ncbi:ECF transporter S component [Blautia sp. XA-2221]|uniref:ECF transporter S component n=1 Tax=Blautia sp. XA-2221 TaxID=2903961 RepID=UPI002378A746|nr:ECF transporter S component [Blautia sp. XA-2221]
MKKENKKINTYQICLVALAVGINIVGGQIALFLKLPVYMDSIGTIFAGAVLGPWFGMIPNILSGIFMGMTVDIYSLYFAPVGILTGLLSGLVFRKMSVKKGKILMAAAVISVPGTVVSALINAVLFGGVTSSGSSILVQLLSKTPLGLTGSIFTVQFLTDYADRCISVLAVSALISAMGGELVRKLSGRVDHNGTI